MYAIVHLSKQLLVHVRQCWINVIDITNKLIFGYHQSNGITRTDTSTSAANTTW